MLLGATILCGLVLLALLAERVSSRVWHGGALTALYRCPDCDLRYPAGEMHDPTFRTCPAGHLVVAERAHSTSASTVGIFVCVGFLAAALILLLVSSGGS